MRQPFKAFIKNQKRDEDGQGFKIIAPAEPSAGSSPALSRASPEAAVSFRQACVTQTDPP
jgi:hypothetical protein